MKRLKEIKEGRRFWYKGVAYRVCTKKTSPFLLCRDCSFYTQKEKPCLIIPCCNAERKDGKDVYFIRLYNFFEYINLICELSYFRRVRVDLIKTPIEEAAGLSVEAFFDKVNMEIKRCEELLSK